MTHEKLPASTDLLALPLLAQTIWEVGWMFQFALWHAMLAPFCSSHDHANAHPKGQLAIPEPIAEEDEHGLFA